MTTRTEIAAKLDDFSYQKLNFGGFLMNKRAKISHALWTRAADKGVTELALLATRDFGEGTSTTSPPSRSKGPSRPRSSTS